MKIENPKLKEAFDYLSQINQTAYEDELLITNNVLSKNPFCSSFIINFFLNNPPKKTQTYFKVGKLIAYYKNNFFWLIAYILKKFVHLLSRQSYRLPEKNKNLILIDTTIYVKRAITESHLSENLLPGLVEYLKNKKISYALTPVLYDSANLIELFMMFRLFKKNKTPILSEYEVVHWRDLGKILSFIFLYPVSLGRLIKSLKTSYKDQLLAHALWETLDDCVAYSFLRLLYGKGMHKILPTSKIKCISWYENQARSKSFYKGLSSNSKKVELCGAQLLIWPESVLNNHPDTNEIKFGIVPKKIIVNGPYYLANNSQINYLIGPSLRYKNLFNINVSPSKSNDILVVSSAWDEEIDKTISFLLQFPKNIELKLKLHPSTNIKKYQKNLPANIKIIDINLYKCFETAKLVMGRSTGVLVEAISLGIPTIVLADKGLCHNFIPSDIDGKGILWNKAFNVAGAIELMELFKKNLLERPDEIKSLSKKYKNLFFSEPNMDKITEAFELNI